MAYLIYTWNNVCVSSIFLTILYFITIHIHDAIRVQCVLINEIRIITEECVSILLYRICYVCNDKLQERSEMPGREKDRTSEMCNV